MSANVAVLMAAYNGESFVREQVVSVFSQVGVHVTLFVSVDVSQDQTLQILRDLSCVYRIRILPYGQRYGSAGANFFRLISDCELLEFDYISFCDQDDIWLERKLIDAIERMRHGEYDGYSSNVLAYWPDGKTKLVKKNAKQTRWDYLFESAGPGCTFVLTAHLYSNIRESLRDSELPVSTLWLHDWYIYSFSRFNNYSWFIDSVPSMLYRQHGQNQVGANTGLMAFYNRCYSVLSGEALTLVANQAKFLKQCDCVPVRLLQRGTPKALVTLAFLAFRCRRALKDKVFMFFGVLFRAFVLFFR